MNSKKKAIVMLCLVLAFVLLLGGAYVLYEKLGETAAPNQLAVNDGQTDDGETEAESDGETEENDTQKVQAMDFTVYDKEGNEVHLSDYLGKPVVMNFWASWCGPCQSEMPDFQDKYEEQGEDIQFLMINLTDGFRETVDSASAFMEDKGYTFPVLYDKDYEAANTYGAYSIPMTVLIDSEGYIRAHAVGAIDGETLQIGIDMITE